MGFEDRHKPLLERRVPRAEIELGRAYVIHARNGGVGVAMVGVHDLGYQLHREKFGHHYLFVELDWDQGPPFGTAIPLLAISEKPPADETRLLAWLREQEVVHRATIDAGWQIVLRSAR